MKMKKILASILALCMVLSTMGMAVSAEEYLTWAEMADTSWYTAGETEFKIDSAKALAGLAKLVNDGTDSFAGKTVNLTQDIDLNQDDWTSIGTASKPFLGTFDGQGNTISNLWCAADQNGLFGYTGSGNRADGWGNEAIIKNFTIDGAVVTDNSQKHEGAGAVVGCGNMHTTVQNVNVKGQIIITGARAGGILGYAYSGARIDNCHVDGACEENDSRIHALYWACGGIMGFGGNDGDVGITNCTVKNIDIDAVNNYGAGGILGNGGSGKVENVAVENVTCSVAYEKGAVYYISGGPTATGEVYISGVVAKVNGEAVEVTGEDLTNAVIPVASINGKYYTNIKDAVKDAADTATESNPVTVQLLAGEFEQSIVLPSYINHVTFKGADNYKTVLKNSSVGHSGGQSTAISNITFDGIDFYNSSINLTAIYDNTKIENLAITNCKFHDITGKTAVTVNTNSKPNLVGFTFTGNTIENVSGGSFSGLVLRAAPTGEIIITNNTINNVAWNAIQLVGAAADATVVIKDNTLASGAEEGILNLYGLAGGVLLENNVFDTFEGQAEIGYFTPTATINGKTYGSIDSAVAAIEDGQTLEILAGEYPCFDIPKRVMNIKVVGETDANGNNLVTILAAADSNDGSWWHSFAGEARNLIFKTEQGKASTKGEDGVPAFDTLSMYCNCAGTPANAKFYDCDFLGQGIAFGGDVDFYGCDFDGLGYAGNAFSYCVPTGIENYIIDVEDCTFKNYTFCTIQLTEGDGKATLNVKDSDVDGAWEMGAMKDINITNSTINSDINIYGTTTVNVDDASVISEGSKVVALYDGVATVNGIQGEGASNVGNVYYGVSAAETFMADTLTVEFEPVAQEAVEDEYSDLYNINIKGNKEFINRLSSADLTFDFAHTDAVNADMAYEIIEVDPVSVTTDIDFADRYMFSFDGVTAPDESGASITIGQVKISGYGTYSLTVKGGEKNIVNTAEVIDNIVEHFYVGGAAAGDKELNLGNGTGEHTITVPTRTLTVNIDFPNAVKDNDITYQDMTVVISGEDIEDITYHLGKGTDACDVAMVDDNYVIEVANKLTLNTSYDIVVTGAGYRTARYTVRMTDKKTVNFWNNVKDADAVVEGKFMQKKNFLAGDIVKDNKINTYDLSAVVSYFGEEGLSETNNKGYAKYDLNRDGFIDSKDVAIVLVSWGN